jgi:hypothetical protein
MSSFAYSRVWESRLRSEALAELERHCGPALLLTAVGLLRKPRP